MSRDPTEDRVMQGPPGAEIEVGGRRYLYFGGTSYLGLHGHPEVIEAACAAARRYGIHTATSRSRFGNSPPVLDAERAVAELFGSEDAYAFASGYLGNDIVSKAIGDRFDAVFVDEHAHYSVVDAARASGRPLCRFRTRDPDDLSRVLREHLAPRQRPLVMTDGVFASWGHIAPVDEYCRVLAPYPGASIVVDDCHGVGVLGARGRGTLDHLGLCPRGVNRAGADAGPSLYLCATLSKALGGFGGIVPGEGAFIAAARSASSYYDGASGLPAPVAAASAAAIGIVRREPERRQRLLDNIRLARQGLSRLGIAVDDLPTPIVGFVTGDARRMQGLAAALRDDGILLPYARAYSGLGPEGAMRLAVFADHTPAMIERLCDALGRRL